MRHKNCPIIILDGLDHSLDSVKKKDFIFLYCEIKTQFFLCKLKKARIDVHLYITSAESTQTQGLFS